MNLRYRMLKSTEESSSWICLALNLRHCQSGRQSKNAFVSFERLHSLNDLLSRQCSMLAIERSTIRLSRRPCSKWAVSNALLARTSERHPTLAPHSKLLNPTKNSSFNSPTHRLNQVAGHFGTIDRPYSTMSGLPISERGYHPSAPGSYSVRKIGAPNTLEHRIYIEKDGYPVSPFHDIPLYANEQKTVLNMIVEIPRWTNAKVEVCY